jgi:carbon-monoxide dehydrogenase small subunit
MAAHALLDRCPDPTDTEIREQLSGNICRCTGYGRIIEAVRNVSESRSAPGGADLDSRTGGEPE